ncbi:cylicin-1 [Perognathus longimembris pacificus]|uniref:cylicin-1 n=1 Tax=Perognathus longimembris pacificus TaxID=214514 RepID=UPI0020197524|nr:cylicin-1 [Perognathus longimembris pacificus]
MRQSEWALPMGGSALLCGCAYQSSRFLWGALPTFSETSEKSWNQEHFVLTFPKPPVPDRKERSSPSEPQIMVLKQNQNKIEKDRMSIDMWMRHSLRELLQTPSISVPVMTQTPSIHPYACETFPIREEIKKPEDSGKITTLKEKLKNKTGPCATSPESKKIVKGVISKTINEADKFPSKSLHKSELFKKSKTKSETNPESKYCNATSKKALKEVKKEPTLSEGTDTESIHINKNPKTDFMNIVNEDYYNKSRSCSINRKIVKGLKVSDITYLDSYNQTINCSQNNSKRPSKKAAKKTSDAESGDLKDTKKSKKDAKKGDKKKESKRDEESSDIESGDTEVAKKDPKKGKKDLKKGVKKKNSKKDVESSEADSGDTEVSKKDLKKGKRGSKKDDKFKDSKKSTGSVGAEYENSKDLKKDPKKGKKGLKKEEKKDIGTTDSESEKDLRKGKKDIKKERKTNLQKPPQISESTDADSESESDSKQAKKDPKKGKKDSKKEGDKKKDTKKNVVSTETESDVEPKKGKKDLKNEGKGAKTFKKNAESTDVELSDSLLSKVKKFDDSDITSIDSKREIPETKKGFRLLAKKTTFREMGEITSTNRIPSSRERAPLPPCELYLQSPKIRRICQCNLPPTPPRPRYAPLPEAKWIHKLL